VRKPSLAQPARLAAVVVYALAFLAVGRFVQGQFLPPADLGGLWFYAGVAALLLGAFLQEPFYGTPADALLNGVALAIAMIVLATTGAQADRGVVELGRYLLMGYAAVVIAVAAIAVGFKDEVGLPARVAAASARLARAFGSGLVLYSIVFFAAVYAAFANDAGALAALYLTWVVFFELAPIERLIAFVGGARRASSAFGKVEQVIIDPGLVIIRAARDTAVEVGAQLELGEPPRTAVVVNRTTLLGEPRLHVAVASGTAVHVGSDVRPRVAPPVPDLVGFTDIGTTLSDLKVELVAGGATRGLEVGRLLEVTVGDRPTLFQLVSGEIDKEVVRDHVRTPSHAVAAKLGRWNAELSNFQLEPWMPEPGTPAALVNVVAAPFDSKYLGHVPDTAYGIGVKIHHAVTHNTAVLGILGVGKTTLAWELIRRMLAEEIKVVVLDITDRYAAEFVDVLPAGVQEDHEAAIEDRIAARLKNVNIVPGTGEAGNVGDFDVALRELLGRFMRGPARLMVVNPNHFNVSRMAMYGGYSKPTQALRLERLSMVDITRKVSEVLLDLVRALPTPEDERARLCLVLEEAHSLVPEWNAGTDEKADREAVNGTVKALLQGRKYGYGCLVITQRTANVTKSILNQCNTILGMRVYDTTGMGFLENYIGATHAKLLATLKDRHAVFFGRASTCAAPIVVRLNDAAAFRAGYWERVVEDAPRTPVFDRLETRTPAAAGLNDPVIAPPVAGGEMPLDAETVPLSADAVQWEDLPDPFEPEVEDD
jgi:hypothetical protein